MRSIENKERWSQSLDRSFYDPVSNKTCMNCWFNRKPSSPCEHMSIDACGMHSYSEPSLTKIRVYNELTETKRLMKKDW